MYKIKVFSAEDVTRALPMPEAINAMAAAFIQISSGEAIVPLRTSIKMSRKNAGALIMPGYLHDEKLVGVKVVNVHNNNPQKGLPRIHALVQVFDAETGRPLAVFDGESLTSIRTGAVSGLATKLLARENSETLFVIGTGAQAYAQIEAVLCVRKIKKVLVFDIDKNKADLFADKISKKFNVEIKVAIKISEVEHADIICTATSSTVSVFNNRDLKTGTHINGIGSYRPDMCEIPPETIMCSKLFVDQKEACLAEAGDIVQPIDSGLISADKIYAELGEVITGSKTGRETEEEITVFKSVGLALQDIAAAKIILDKAEELKLGTEVNL